MGIVQIAQTILASVLIPLKQEIAHLDVEKKVIQTIWASVYSPPPANRQCPYGNNTFPKGASLSEFHGYSQSTYNLRWT